MTINRSLRPGTMALAMALAACSAERAQDLPEGAVSDEADILPAAVEASLEKRLEDYWRSSGNAVVVASVNSLNDQSIEQVASERFNRWAIGGAQAKRGVLLLVAPTERVVRIEVGCGLESVISSETAAEVIENNIMPHFQNQDLAAGTAAGVDVLVSLLAKGQDPHPTSQHCIDQMSKAA